MRKFFLAAVLLFCLFPAGSNISVSSPSNDRDSTFDAILGKISIAFRRGSSKPLVDICSPNSRIHLALAGTEIPEKYVSPDQLYFLLDRFFSNRKPLKFKFLPAASHSGLDPTSRIATWTYQEGKQKPRTITLQFRFTSEGKRKVLTEIRVLP